jgi:hypothetical protein
VGKASWASREAPWALLTVEVVASPSLLFLSLFYSYPSFKYGKVKQWAKNKEKKKHVNNMTISGIGEPM